MKSGGIKFSGENVFRGFCSDQNSGQNQYWFWYQYKVYRDFFLLLPELSLSESFLLTFSPIKKETDIKIKQQNKSFRSDVELLFWPIRASVHQRLSPELWVCSASSRRSAPLSRRSNTANKTNCQKHEAAQRSEPTQLLSKIQSLM